MVWCILLDSGFLSSMWGDLFMATAYLKNRTPHKVFQMKTPFKLLHGKEVDLSHLNAIGDGTFVHKNDSRKLAAVASRGKICGYSEERKL